MQLVNNIRVDQFGIQQVFQGTRKEKAFCLKSKFCSGISEQENVRF